MAKIMFNDDVNLTQLVLERIKNMTRRTIPQKTLDFVFNDFRQTYYEASLDWLTEKETLEQCFFVDKMKKLPYQIGDVVAIAQSYKDAGYTKEWVEQHIKPNPKAKPTDSFEKRYTGWNNKMFVKADLMPHRIRITDIKVELLQDISDEDCLKEGIICNFNDDNTHGWQWNPDALPFDETYQTAREAFAALIDKVSGRGTWERNPWVFAYSYELVK